MYVQLNVLNTYNILSKNHCYIHSHDRRNRGPHSSYVEDTTYHKNKNNHSSVMLHNIKYNT